MKPGDVATIMPTFGRPDIEVWRDYFAQIASFVGGVVETCPPDTRVLVVATVDDVAMVLLESGTCGWVDADNVVTLNACETPWPWP